MYQSYWKSPALAPSPAVKTNTASRPQNFSRSRSASYKFFMFSAAKGATEKVRRWDLLPEAEKRSEVLWESLRIIWPPYYTPESQGPKVLVFELPKTWNYHWILTRWHHCGTQNTRRLLNVTFEFSIDVRVVMQLFYLTDCYLSLRSHG